ncbi:hypothetical protein QZH41_012507 [Actinostola sp. cb2023]|nr:hypothetical protein QZH41_012507 [Actinostola sp. cb2023]
MMMWTVIGLCLAVSITLVNGMCWPEHVQTQFCNADFVVRAKIISTVKFELPEFPKHPTKGHRGNGRGNGKDNNNNNKDNNSKKQHKTVDPAPMRGLDPIAPAPRRFARSVMSGFSGVPVRPRNFPEYQDIKIKRILKGVVDVKETVGTTPVDNTTNSKYTRYYSRAYIRNPGFKLKPGKAYLLAGKIIHNKLWVSFCDWHTEWNVLGLDQLRGLKKDFIHGCKCRVLFCYYPGCEDNNHQRDVCMWKPDSFYPGDDCRAKHSTCRAHKGRCQWKHSERFVKCKKNKEMKKNKVFPL